MIYKLPKGSGVREEKVPDGTAFYYMDIRRKLFQVSPVSLNDPNQSVAYTLQQYYNAIHDPNTFHVMYNDEPPGTKDIERDEQKGEKAVEFGHTKGV